MERSAVGRHVPPRNAALGCVIALLAAAALLLAHASPAGATPSSFVWTGESTKTAKWSETVNWEGGTAPKASEDIETLTFPQLTSTACTTEPKKHACYFSEDDLAGLTTEALELDDGNSYALYGKELKLGEKGLNATPHGEGSGEAYDLIKTPLDLVHSQTWQVAGRGAAAAEFDENGVALFGDVSGERSSLAIAQSEGSELYLENKIDVGPVAFEGVNAGVEPFENGLVVLNGEGEGGGEGEVNAADKQAVDLRHLWLLGDGSVGALATDDTDLEVGSGAEPAGRLQAASADLDRGSLLILEASASGAAAGEDYSQLSASGAIELGGAEMSLLVLRPEGQGPCPALTRGETLTLVSTSGSLSGTFANAPEGPDEIPILYGDECKGPKTMRIAYNRSGTEKTVTGEVEAAQAEAEAAAAKAAAEKAEQEAAAEQARLRKLHEEEVKLEALLKKVEEQAAAKAEVLATKEASPDATIAGTSLQVSASGWLTFTVECPAGVSTCTGIVTLRTLHAVIASAAAGAAASKAKIVTLASGTFSVAGGRGGTVKLHLSAAVRALIARLHTLKVQATIASHDPQGASHIAYALLTVRAPKPRHKG